MLSYYVLDASVSSQVEVLEVVTQALTSLLHAQPAMLDQVPQLGHMPQLFKTMSSTRNPAVPKHAIMIIRELSENEVS